MIHALVLLALLHAPATGPRPAHAQGLQITQALLDEAVARARPAVERALGYPIPEGFAGARLASPAELEDVIASETAAVLASQLPDPALAPALARQFAASSAPNVLMKYAHARREILVNAQGFQTIAQMMRMPELLDPAVVQAVIVHELVHAADIHVYDIHARLASFGSQDRVMATQAVLEGHAQRIARAVCAELGLAREMAIFTRAITSAPPDEAAGGELLRLVRWQQRDVTASLYRDGEAFVSAIADEAGPEAVVRAFRDPPSDMAAVRQPRWFLHPEERPRVRYDLAAAADTFDSAYASSGWQSSRVPIGDGELRMAFQPLGAEHVAGLLTDFRGATKVQRLSNPAALHYALTTEWGSTAGAERFYEATTELTRLRDQQMSQGLVRIASASYRTIDLGRDTRAMLGVKILQSSGGSVQVLVVLAQRGPLVFELLRSGLTGSADDMIALTRRVMEAASVTIPPRDLQEDEPAAPGSTEGTDRQAAASRRLGVGPDGRPARAPARIACQARGAERRTRTAGTGRVPGG